MISQFVTYLLSLHYDKIKKALQQESYMLIVSPVMELNLKRVEGLWLNPSTREYWELFWIFKFSTNLPKNHSHTFLANIFMSKIRYIWIEFSMKTSMAYFKFYLTRQHILNSNKFYFSYIIIASKPYFEL